MNLTWHIVRKDLQRVWPWLMLSVMAMVGRYVWFKLLEHGVLPMADETYGRSLHWHVDLVNVAWLCVEYVAVVFGAAAVFLEDAPAEDRAFWRTRPIGSARMLTAKFISGGLICFVLPMAVKISWWCVNGFVWPEVQKWLLAAVLLHLVIFAGTWGVASLTRSTGAFTTGVLMLASYGGVLTAVASAQWQGRTWPSGDLIATRLVLCGTALTLCILGTTTRQYLTANTRANMITLVSAAVLLLLACPFWQTRYNFGFRELQLRYHSNPVVTSVTVDEFDGQGRVIIRVEFGGIDDDLGANVSVKRIQWSRDGTSMDAQFAEQPSAPQPVRRGFITGAVVERPGVRSCRIPVWMPKAWTAETFRDKNVGVDLSVTVILWQREQIGTALPLAEASLANNGDMGDRILRLSRDDREVVIHELKRRSQFSGRSTTPWLLPASALSLSPIPLDRQGTRFAVQSSAALQVDFITLRYERYTVPTSVVEQMNDARLVHIRDRPVGSYNRDFSAAPVRVVDAPTATVAP